MANIYMIKKAIKNCVHTAIKSISKDGHKPSDGCEHRSRNNVLVIFNKPISTQSRPTYRIIHPDFGVYIGDLSDFHGTTVGNPTQIMTKEQMISELALENMENNTPEITDYMIFPELFC